MVVAIYHKNIAIVDSSPTHNVGYLQEKSILVMVALTAGTTPMCADDSGNILFAYVTIL